MRTLIALVTIGGALAAQPQRIAATAHYRTFSRQHPALARVDSGGSVVVALLDAGGLDEKGERRAEPYNPLTGPFFIESAEPGDAVSVRIVRLTMNRNWGWSAYRLGLFSLLPDYVERIYPKMFRENAALEGRSDLLRWEIDLDARTVRLKEPASRRVKLEFAAEPMLGCVGVAAPGDMAPTSGISGSWGGNLDYNRIGEGATVILPVYHRGALVFVGDGHALQADGEPAGTGIETSMEVELRFEVLKKSRVTGPRVETKDLLISVGSQAEFVSSLDRGLQLATTDMVRWLEEQGVEPWAAHMLVAFQGRYDVVTAAGSVALRIPKAALAPPR